MLFCLIPFSLDDNGNVSRITHSVTKRDSFFSIEVEQVDEWYNSWKIFIDLLYEEAVYFKTEPGSWERKITQTSKY